MTIITNTQRANRALKALDGYSDDVAGSPIEIAGDLVADILHLVRLEGVACSEAELSSWLQARLRVMQEEVCDEHITGPDSGDIGCLKLPGRPAA